MRRGKRGKDCMRGRGDWERRNIGEIDQRRRRV